MKIRKVKWKDHPVLGDLLLDFISSATGEPSATIVFAGENGTGKSTILEDLSSFLNLGSFERFEFIEYAVNGDIYKAVPTSEKESAQTRATHRVKYRKTLSIQGTTVAYSQKQDLTIRPRR